MITVKDAVFNLLRAHGLTTIFGNPGSTEMAMLSDWPSDFKYISGLHEGSVLAMADGYARATRKPAVVVLHTAAGTGNAMGSIVNAFSAKCPLVIIAGQQSRSLIKTEPILTNTNSVLLTQPYTKFSCEPSRAQDVPDAIARAIYTSTLLPQGPTFISVPQDDWSKEIDDSANLEWILNRKVDGRFRLNQSSLEMIISHLINAKNPLLIVGDAVDSMEATLDAVVFSEYYRIPVMMGPMPSRWAFPSDHKYFRGVLPSGIHTLSEKLKGYDVVLSIGAPIFRYMEDVAGKYLPEGTHLIAIVDDPAEAARASFGDAILSDPAIALQELIANAPIISRPEPEHSKVVLPVQEEFSAPFSPAAVFDVIRKAVPQDTVFVNESTSNVFPFWQRVPLTVPGGYYFPGAGGLGFGLSGAVGVQMADINRPVVAVIGDGAAHYGITGLWTAAQYNIPVIWIIMRNGSYGALNNLEGLMDLNNVPGIDLPHLESAKIAEGYGVDSIKINNLTQLENILLDIGKDRSNRKPLLIEVPVTTISPY